MTLREWAPTIGRFYNTVRQWPAKPDFPQPQGQRARARGVPGPGEYEYSRRELNAWLDQQRTMRAPAAVAVDADPEQLVSLAAFARLIRRDRKTVYQYREHADHPAPVQESDEDRPRSRATARLYRLGDLLDFWNARPGLTYPRGQEAGPQ